MPIHKVCHGIPGAGKTTFGVGLARGWIDEEGVRPDEIAYLGFTKAAARVAVTRVAGEDPGESTDSDYPLFRTIHSLCYMGLRRQAPGVNVINSSHMKKFSAASSMEGVFAVSAWEDLADVYAKMEDRGRTDWDHALTAYSLSRISASSVEDLDRARIEPSSFACSKIKFLAGDVYRAFVSKYETWKKASGLIDFTDMLEFALRDMLPIDSCRKVVVDEAQDLCPLHHAIIDRVFRSAEEIWWVGDDDQAIFNFSGASAELFLKRVAQARYSVDLQKTNRYSQEIVEFSQKIIRRVRVRHEKTIIGVPGRASKITLSGRFEPVLGDMLVLHRHVAGCYKAAQAYMDAGLPFRNERGKDPLGSSTRIKCWTAVDLLSRGQPASISLARALIEEALPSVLKDDARTRAVVHGAKRRLDEEVNVNYPVTLEDLVRQEILTPAGANVVREKRFEFLQWQDDLSYYDRLSQNGHSLAPKKCPVITTIHGSKGREAEDGVLIFSQMGARCWDDPDTEHRLAYVAATRTKRGLEVCADDMLDWAQTKYDYPMEEAP